MFYLIALKTFAKKEKNSKLSPKKIRGVLYNVIRRPLARGAKHCIRQRQNETEKGYYERLSGLIEKDSKFFFYRWNSVIRNHDYKRFKNEVFHPILETFLDWWESLNGVRGTAADSLTGNLNGATPFEPWNSHLHYRFPFGVWNSLWDGWRGDYFELLTTGRKDKLVKIKTLYPELNT